MSQIEQSKLHAVLNYHQQTKHRLERYAASLGYMDWANQPNPFRTYDGSEPIDLFCTLAREEPSYDDLYASSPNAEQLNADLLSRLLLHSLALSAWKQAPGSNPWSLRVNPSSGALHPTEGYLITGSISGLIDQPGVFHYAPFGHRLERRCQLSEQQWDSLVKDFPQPCLLFGLSSIYWRESWKYGARAFRYCHHDVGHAIGAVAFSARVLGWQTQLVETLADEDLNRLIGTHLQTGIEAEHADCLLALFPAQQSRDMHSVSRLSPKTWRERIPHMTFVGEPNRLSPDHHPWPVIDEVSRAIQTDHSADIATYSGLPDFAQNGVGLRSNGSQSAEQIILQRRSAVAMDGNTSISRDAFYQMLQSTLPGEFPFATLTWRARVSLAIFVHRVDDLQSGLYILVRSDSHERLLRQSLKPEFDWCKAEGSGDRLNLYRLQSGDARHAAKTISCHQDIASDSIFSLGMLAEFEATLIAEGARFYPRLFWESGLIGQVLYLEAEAAGVRGTGIGCFFDDVMHDLLGIKDRSWQSLYHFTVGGPVEDTRLKTIAPYAHLVSDA